MTWVTHYNGDYWKIESSLVSFITNNGYKWEKTFVRLTCKDVVNQSVLTVDGEDYEFFADNEVSIIEITDLIRSTDSGTITFVNQAELTVFELEYISFDGERENMLNKDYLPKEIPIIFLTNDFYVQTDEKLAYWSTDNLWEPFYGGGPMTSINVNSVTDFNWALRAYDGPLLGEETINFIELPCPSDAVLLEWVGRFGLRKSWWFKIDSLIYNSDKQLNVQTMDSSYDTRKNKKSSIFIEHKGADHITQQYLSDLVLSDDVSVYWSDSEADKHRVRVETNSFEVTQRKRDVQITLNTFDYDTI